MNQVDDLLTADELRDLIKQRYGFELRGRTLYRFLKHLGGVGRVRLPGLRTRYSTIAICTIIER